MFRLGCWKRWLLINCNLNCLKSKGREKKRNKGEDSPIIRKNRSLRELLIRKNRPLWQLEEKWQDRKNSKREGKNRSRMHRSKGWHRQRQNQWCSTKRSKRRSKNRREYKNRRQQNKSKKHNKEECSWCKDKLNSRQTPSKTFKKVNKERC